MARMTRVTLLRELHDRANTLNGLLVREAELMDDLSRVRAAMVAAGRFLADGLYASVKQETPDGEETGNEAP